MPNYASIFRKIRCQADLKGNSNQARPKNKYPLALKLKIELIKDDIDSLKIYAGNGANSCFRECFEKVRVSYYETVVKK